MKHYIVPDNAKIINPKWIVIQNFLDEIIYCENSNKKICNIDAKKQLFKLYNPDDIIYIYTKDNVKIKTRSIGYIIHISVYLNEDRKNIWNNNFYLGCGGISSVYQKDISVQEITLAGLKKISISSITLIETLQIHYSYYNPQIQPKHETPLIPLNMHFIWLKNKEESEFNMGYFETWYNNNPNLTYYIWTNFDIDNIPDNLKNKNNIVIKYDSDIKLLLNKYSSKTTELYDIIPLMGGKSDILRYIILYDMGGLYVDINDFECFKNLEELFYKYSFICGAETSYADVKDMLLLNNAFIASKPKHIIIERIINAVNDIDIDELKEDHHWSYKDNLLASMTGVGVFRSNVLGYFLDPEIKDKSTFIVLPSIYIYPSCFYNDNDIHLINYKNNKNKWLHPESYASHYSEHSYLDID